MNLDKDKSFLQKLKSRKFIASLLGAVTGIAIIFGLDENVVFAVSGAIVTLSSLVTYIITEGKVDIKAITEYAASRATDEEEEVAEDYVW